MQRLDAIGAGAAGRCPPGRRRADAAARGRVRGRAPHRDRNRGRCQAGEHPERRRIAGADPAAPLPRVPERVAPRLRRAAIDDVARRGARPAGARRGDALGRGDRGRPPCSSAWGSTAWSSSTSRIGSRWPTGSASTESVATLGGPSASMLLGMLTTAATFYGLVFVDFPSLQQLGLVIGHSMVACGVLTLVLVPALLPTHRPRGPIRVVDVAVARVLDRRRHRTRVLAVSAVATVALGAASLRLHVDTSLERMRSTTPGALFEESVRERCSDCRATSTCGSQHGPALEPLLAGERGAGRPRARRGAADSRSTPPSALAAIRRGAGAVDGARPRSERRSRRRSRPRWCGPRRTRDSATARSIPFFSVSRGFSIPAAPDLSTAIGSTASAT